MALRSSLAAICADRRGQYPRGMSGRDLKALLWAYREHDEMPWRRAALENLEEEEAKRHATVAQVATRG